MSRGDAALMLVLTTAVLAGLLVPWQPTAAQAQRYGRRYKYGYGAQIARCKGYCQGTAGAISGCRRRFVSVQRTQCRNAFKAARTACGGDRICRQSVKGTLRGCIGDAVQQARQDRGVTNTRGCARCCRQTRGDGSCVGYMSGSRFYGSYRYRGRLFCVDAQAGDGGGGGGRRRGSPSPAFASDITDRVRAGALDWLGRVIGRLGC